MNARDRLSAIAARAEAATPGPWEVYDMGDEVYTSENKRGWWWVWRAGEKFYAGVMEVDHSLDPDMGPGNIGQAAITDNQDGEPERIDAEFIAHARADVPALVAFATAVLDLAGRADVQLGFGCLCSGDEHDPATTYCRYGEAMAWDLDPDDILTLADEHLGGAS